MTVSVADIHRWDPGDVREVFHAVGSGTTHCGDDPQGPNAPVHFEDWRDTKLPPGTDFTAIIAQTGDTWRKWGW